MSSVSSSAAPCFPLLGEPLSLDLVNTCIRKDGSVVDLLDRPSALAAWLAAEAGRQPWSGAVTAMDLKAVRDMRDAIATLLAAQRDCTPPSPTALRSVNQALAIPAPSTKLIWTSTGPGKKVRSASGKRDALLRALAIDAISLLTGPQGKLLRVCEHPDCILQFLACHPHRRWCSAAACGNRARVARHYHRQRASD